MNPYDGQTFFGFFLVMAHRLWGWLSGNIHALTSDEVQVLVLAGVAISSAMVGTLLVLRKMTMLANALSHTILLGIVLVFVLAHDGVFSEATHGHDEPLKLQAMLLAALGMGFVTTFLTEFLNKVVKLQEDASIGLVFTSLFALGIVLVTLLTRNVHISTEVVMGNVDALHVDDLQLVFVVLCLNILLFMLFFKEFKITTFDTGLSKALGISPLFFNYLLMIQVSATAIGAFRAVGVLMVLAFLTGPALTARLLTHDLRKMIFLACGIGCLASLFGVALSRHLLSVYGLALSTAGLVVCILVVFFLAAAIRKTIRIKRYKSKNTQFEDIIGSITPTTHTNN